MSSRIPFIAFFLFVAAAMFALGMLANPSHAQKRPTVTVSRVVDGDTIEISPAMTARRKSGLSASILPTL